MIKGINNNNTQKGFTLIEVILSIALLGIISVAFLTMFTSGIVGITNSGKKSISHYTAQSQIESEINESGNISNVVTSTTEISLTFPEKSLTYVIEGRQLDVPYTYGNLSKNLTTFTTK